MVWVIYLFLWFAGHESATALATHPFYVSMIDMHYNPASQNLELSFRIFTDDLELGAGSYAGESLVLENNSQARENEALVFAYLRHAMRISVDQKSRQLYWIGMEVESDVVWCYLEVPNVPGQAVMSGSLTLLTEHYDTQTNLLNLHRNNKVSSALLHREKTGFEFAP